MANTIHRTEIFGTEVAMIADWDQSAGSIWMQFGDSESYCTGRQVADFGHSSSGAMRHFLEEYVSEGGDDPEDFAEEIDAAIEAMDDVNRGDMDDEELLEDLGDIDELRVDHSDCAYWIDDNGTVWVLPVKAHIVDDDAQNRVIMWSDTDEAGIDDITVESGWFPDSQKLQYFARDLADSLGTRFDGHTCPDCGESIAWSGIQTGGQGNHTDGTCGCSGRSWTSTERGSDWATGYSDNEEDDDA